MIASPRYQRNDWCVCIVSYAYNFCAEACLRLLPKLDVPIWVIHNGKTNEHVRMFAREKQALHVNFNGDVSHGQILDAVLYEGYFGLVNTYRYVLFVDHDSLVLKPYDFLATVDGWLCDASAAGWLLCAYRGRYKLFTYPWMLASTSREWLCYRIGWSALLSADGTVRFETGQRIAAKLEIVKLIGMYDQPRRPSWFHVGGGWFYNHEKKDLTYEISCDALRCAWDRKLIELSPWERGWISASPDSRYAALKALIRYAP